MWSPSILVLNPYEATLQMLEKKPRKARVIDRLCKLLGLAV